MKKTLRFSVMVVSTCVAAALLLAAVVASTASAGKAVSAYVVDGASGTCNAVGDAPATLRALEVSDELAAWVIAPDPEAIKFEIYQSKTFRYRGDLDGVPVDPCGDFYLMGFDVDERDSSFGWWLVHTSGLSGRVSIRFLLDGKVVARDSVVVKP